MHPTSYYTVVGGCLQRQYRIDNDHRATLRAESIRQERTGVHARVSIAVNGATLAWGVVNVDKDEDRVRLSNSAYAHLNGLSTTYPKSYLKKDLDDFAAGLWDAQLGQSMPTYVEGCAEAKPPSFLLRPFVLAGGGTIMFAPPGRGKSYVLLLMAVCLDAGLSGLWPVTPARVLFINLERSAASMTARLGNVNAALGLERTRPLLMLNRRGKSLMECAPSIERCIQEEHVDCLWLDSISRAGAGDLTENKPVNQIVDTLNGLCGTWAGIAHTPRNDESHLYGSVHFEAGADVVVQLLSQQDEDKPLGIGLQIIKQNDIGKTPMWLGALDFTESGLASVRHAHRGEFPEVEGGRRLSMRDAVRQHLLDMGACSAEDIAEATGFHRTNVAHLLSSDPIFVLGGKLGKRLLYGVKA